LLPLNPAHLGAVSPDSAFNTAISFATNTSWQSYAGETTLGYVAQLVGITSQSFLSAATGIAVLMALLRGFARVGARTLGNVWVDLTRSTLYVLLPVSGLFAVLLISQGAIQNLSPNRLVALLEPVSYAVPELGPDGTPLNDAQGKPIVTRYSPSPALWPPRHAGSPGREPCPRTASCSSAYCSAPCWRSVP